MIALVLASSLALGVPSVELGFGPLSGALYGNSHLRSVLVGCTVDLGLGEWVAVEVHGSGSPLWSGRG